MKSIIGLFSLILVAGLQVALHPPTTPTDKDALTYLLEEEKLARDLYLGFAEQWGAQVFSNIAQAEQHHLDMMTGLLKTEGVALPSSVKRDRTGEFTVPAIRKLYQQLSTQGAQSLQEALRVGALIEETDITDLQQRTSQASPAAQAVFERLIFASGNHLRAFVRNLEKQGVTYSPTVMSANAFEQTLAGEQAGPGGGCKGGGACANQQEGQGKGKGQAGKGCCKASKP
ncbi:MAG: DUF2202 domain-containing protein [Lewinellaceae bacterium]|nr:DUF2202 domain-containing protein [Lewinellaceae bacterium]